LAVYHLMRLQIVEIGRSGRVLALKVADKRSLETTRIRGRALNLIVADRNSHSLSRVIDWHKVPLKGINNFYRI
jgi:hypothetical protein